MSPKYFLKIIFIQKPFKTSHYMAEFKIAVGHQPFSNRNWLFPTKCKVFGPFSDYLITLNPQNYIKWPYTFVHDLKYLAILSIPYFELYQT